MSEAVLRRMYSLHCKTALVTGGSCRRATADDLPRQQKFLSRIPMDRLGQPEDIGWACAYLASPAAAYVTGQVLLVDGGGATGF